MTFICQKVVTTATLNRFGRFCPRRFVTGNTAKPGEFVYDHPFQWGSRRIGPDLAREGGTRSPLWHFRHFDTPQLINDGSIMPSYGWLKNSELDFQSIPGHMKTMQLLGVPYSDQELQLGVELAKQQATDIATKIAIEEGSSDAKKLQARIADLQSKKIVALIAYVDRLGTDLFKTPPAGAEDEQPSEKENDKDKEPQVANTPVAEATR